MLPIVERLLTNNAVDRNQRGRLPRVIVLAPTRELAKQVRPSFCTSTMHWRWVAGIHPSKVRIGGTMFRIKAEALTTQCL